MARPKRRGSWPRAGACAWTSNGCRSRRRADACLDRPTVVIGPFLDWDGQLIRFACFESPARALTVVIRSFVAPDELVLQVPIESTPGANDLHAWTLAAGTVWIRTRFLVAGAEHFAGLRIASGTLTFAGVEPISREHESIIAPLAAAWTLTIVPEAAVATAGSDAAALTIGPPEQIVVGVDRPPVVIGTVRVSGFGSERACEPGAGAAIVQDGLCLLPLTAPPDPWTIDGNRSTLAQFSGNAQVASAGWALPVAPLGPGALPDAPHAGRESRSLPATSEASSAASPDGRSCYSCRGCS